MPRVPAFYGLPGPAQDVTVRCASVVLTLVLTAGPRAPGRRRWRPGALDSDPDPPSLPLCVWHLRRGAPMGRTPWVFLPWYRVHVPTAPLNGTFPVQLSLDPWSH